MKATLNGVSTLFLMLAVQLCFAQQKTVSGTVSDSSGALPGVSIVKKGTKKGTQTDFDGKYKLKVKKGDVLIFSFVGMKTIEMTVGDKKIINVILKENKNVLDEVVVTALGVSRDKKSLGYATQKLKGSELTKTKNGNFVNDLSGKISGVQIKRNNNLGGSTNIVIRGNASLGGNNQALFVVDGVPINNRNTNSESQSQGFGGYYDYGNVASDINPEDIESINVLKGAAASALYGARAANGVIMITTKKGKKTKGIGITINSGISFGQIDKSTFVKYQTSYGAGYGSYYDENTPGSFFKFEDIDGDGKKDIVVPYTEDSSYGGSFNKNLLVYQWDSFDPDSPNYKKATPWVAAKNDPITFFETPFTMTNSISFDKGFDEGSFRLNYTRFSQSGLLPNSEIKKDNFSMSGNFKLSDKLTVTGYANYIKTTGLGRNSTGYSDNIIGGFRQWWQTNADLKQLEQLYFKTKRNITWNPRNSEAGSSPIFWDNPYWTRYENYQNDSRNRFLGNISLTYQITDWLNVMGRVATDTYSEIQEERRAVGSVPSDFGLLRTSVNSGYLKRNIRNTQTNYDLMFNFQKDLSDKVNLKGILGANIRRHHYQSISASTAGGLIVPRLYSLTNTKSKVPAPAEEETRKGVDGVYISGSLGYDNMLFLDATFRRDESSTLPKKNRAFYYPSVSTSFVFSKLINANWLSFGKLRANYAEVGNDAPFNYVKDIYIIDNLVGTLPSTYVSTNKRNPNLKPERTKSMELGLEAKFLKNRIGFDFAFYKTNTIDQILRVPVSRATGYARKILNAGEIQNKGFEVSLFATPIKTDDFTWGININWTKNQNLVVSLADGINNLQLGSFAQGVTLNAEVGKPYGVLYGTDYKYTKKGEKIVDITNGKYLKTANSNNVIGDTNPDWLMGISNSFSYKNISLSFLIDIQQGGSIFSLDQAYGQATGLYAETVFTNDLGNPVRNSIAQGGGFINPGVNEKPDGTIIPNSTRVRADGYGIFGYKGLPNRAFVYDASYIKLRELSITYKFPKQLIQKSFLTDASISFTGSNLWIIHKNLLYADPESGLSSGNIQGYSIGSLPTTRNFGVNVKLQF